MKKRANFPKPSYEIWCKVVDLRLRDVSGRPLADAPVTERELRIWWQAGIPARVVGQALSVRMPKVRYTLTRFYTDRRVQEVRAQVLQRLVVRGALGGAQTEISVSGVLQRAGAGA